jgi:hypothetical protein
MKIVELKIDDSSLSGFDATALVENPAIEQDFIAFNKVKMAELTHNDYPQAAVDAAKRGIELNKENNNKCATQVGKVRAQQLVNGEKLSLDTIQRMRSFLIRQKGNYELATRRKDYTACGYISYLLWGGEAALPWAEKKLRQAGIEFSAYSELKSNIPQMPDNAPPQNFEGLEDACQAGYKAIGLKMKNGRKVPNCVPESQFEEEVANQIIADLLGIDEEDFEINVAGLPNYINEASTGGRKKYFEEEEVLPSILELKKNKFASQLAEKQMLIGPLMTPNKLIPRKDNITGEEYEVFFTADTIEKIAYKMMQDKLLDKVNIEHDDKQPVKDVYLVETWIVKDPEHDKSTIYGFKPVQGQWFGIYRIGDGRVWNEYVKTGKVKGFSVEGYFYNNILTNK